MTCQRFCKTIASLVFLSSVQGRDTHRSLCGPDAETRGPSTDRTKFFEIHAEGPQTDEKRIFRRAEREAAFSFLFCLFLGSIFSFGLLRKCAFKQFCAIYDRRGRSPTCTVYFFGKASFGMGVPLRDREYETKACVRGRGEKR